MRALRFLLLLLLVAPITAQASAKPRLAKEAEARVAAVADRGALLFDIDRAAWVTTDDLRARLNGTLDVPIKGWVVERDGTTPGAFVVTYFGDGPGGGRAAWYVGHVAANRVVSGELLPEGKRPALTPVQTRIADAVDLARRQTQLTPCTAARFNTAAIPPASPEEPVDVYLLSAMVEQGVYPMGGHYLVRVGSDGKIVSTRPFMKSCMNISMPERAGATPAGFMTNHLLDPVPTEIHVFMSRWMNIPVFVGTDGGKRVWAVEGTRIRLVK